jgi:hypothetical protein
VAGAAILTHEVDDFLLPLDCRDSRSDGGLRQHQRRGKKNRQNSEITHILIKKKTKGGE